MERFNATEMNVPGKMGATVIPVFGDGVAVVHVQNCKAELKTIDTSNGDFNGKRKRDQSYPTECSIPVNTSNAIASSLKDPSEEQSRIKAAKQGDSKVRSSKYRGVTRHKMTGRFEAHCWDAGYVPKKVCVFGCFSC